MAPDYVQRFVFEDLNVRGRLVCLTRAWQRMLEGRDHPAEVAALLGHATALAVLLAANRKGSGRITLQVQGSGPVDLLVADCDATLRIRGMARYARGATAGRSERALLGDGRLALTLDDAASGQLYQSLVPLEGESMAEIFEHYLAQSEQVPAFLRLRADAGALAGLLLEKLPEADARDPDGWRRVSHLGSTLSLADARAARAQDLLVRLFPGELLRVFPLDAVEYHCPYDPRKVAEMLRGLGRAEVEAMLAGRDEIVIRNEMCNHEYRFDAAAVAALFDRDAAAPGAPLDQPGARRR
ncbi:MAG: Hsp33 family molecular chaperone HslO [Burkholderiales bacterium]|nr:Hsp33 family molecular chaperone HslO [Burkholderiales bacterium]